MSLISVPVATACTAEDVQRLVADFYELVRRDALLGPIFERHVDDWRQHEERLTAFWSGLLRGEAGFSGSPLSKHLAIDGLNWPLFQRWLDLFKRAAEGMGNPQVADLANERAGRIAEHFWRHYRNKHGD